MKSNFRFPTPLAAFASLILMTPVHAVVSIDYVNVGNAGNGSVAYSYRIGKYEVTNAQYAEFLNAKAGEDPNSLYSPNMPAYGITRNGSTGSFSYNVTGTLANRPIAFISWFDAARFANWLLNGQGSGDTETGAYTLNGAIAGIFYANPDAGIRLPTLNEWYKAAYYDPTKGGTGGYWEYPNRSNTITTADANYLGTASKDVGSYSGDPSYYGTFDQGGNVSEWNDQVVFGFLRGIWGGAYSNDQEHLRAAPNLLDINYTTTDNENSGQGFRLVSVPEPTTLVLTFFASGMILARRRRM